MTNELISIIIPLYNKEKAISQTLMSVLNQTYNNLEIIIADDGSTDNSASIVKKIASEYGRIKYFHKKNGGVSSARNFGLSKASGEWIVFLDADDEMMPNILEVLIGLTEKYNVNIASSNICVKEEDGNIRNIDLRITHEMLFHNFIKALIGNKAIFASGACIYKRSLLGTKPYNENLSRYEDADFELKLFVKSAVAMTPKVSFIHHGEFAELSKIPNNKKEKDFIFNIDFAHKTFWQKIKMGQYINEGSRTYTDGVNSMKARYGLSYYWKYAYLIIRKWLGVEYKLKQLLGFV